MKDNKKKFGIKTDYRTSALGPSPLDSSSGLIYASGIETEDVWQPYFIYLGWIKWFAAVY